MKRGWDAVLYQYRRQLFEQAPFSYAFTLLCLIGLPHLCVDTQTMLKMSLHSCFIPVPYYCSHCFSPALRQLSSLLGIN